MTPWCDDVLWDDEDDQDDQDDQDDDDIAALFVNYAAHVRAGYARPATAAPRQLDLYRGLNDLPDLDDYQPTGSEIRP